MGYYLGGSPQGQQEPQMPSAFFDGIELGVEATMFTILTIAIPAGAHVGLSATLGYATRYTDGMVDGVFTDPKAFSLFGFLFASLLAFLAIALALFAFSAIPTLFYNGVLVALMLRVLGRRREHVKRVSIILGCVLGLSVGILLSSVGFLVTGLRPALETISTLFHWPEIMTIDGITLLWLMLLPIATAAAGARSGRKLGYQLEALTMQWFW